MQQQVPRVVDYKTRIKNALGRQVTAGSVAGAGADNALHYDFTVEGDAVIVPTQYGSFFFSKDDRFLDEAAKKVNEAYHTQAVTSLTGYELRQMDFGKFPIPAVFRKLGDEYKAVWNPNVAFCVEHEKIYATYNGIKVACDIPYITLSRRSMKMTLMPSIKPADEQHTKDGEIATVLWRVITEQAWDIGEMGIFGPLCIASNSIIVKANEITLGTKNDYEYDDDDWARIRFQSAQPITKRGILDIPCIVQGTVTTLNYRTRARGSLTSYPALQSLMDQKFRGMVAVSDHVDHATALMSQITKLPMDFTASLATKNGPVSVWNKLSINTAAVSRNYISWRARPALQQATWYQEEGTKLMAFTDWPTIEWHHFSHVTGSQSQGKTIKEINALYTEAELLEEQAAYVQMLSAEELKAVISAVKNPLVLTSVVQALKLPEKFNMRDTEVVEMLTSMGKITQADKDKQAKLGIFAALARGDHQ